MLLLDWKQISLFQVFIFVQLLIGFCNCLPTFEENKNWTYFVFAQKWPPAACLELPKGKECFIPREVHEWSIHGLWPTSDKGYPSFCNNSWHFNIKTLKSLISELEVKWPNIYAHTSRNTFWKHEWAKHGTCATSLPQFDSEFKYFNRSLMLHDKYNIYEFISKAGITPSDKQPVPLKYIQSAVALKIDKKVKFFCKNHKDYAYPILTSMYVCLDKNEALIDCDKIDEPECDKPELLYLPFNYTISNTIWKYSVEYI